MPAYGARRLRSAPDRARTETPLAGACQWRKGTSAAGSAVRQLSAAAHRRAPGRAGGHGLELVGRRNGRLLRADPPKGVGRGTPNVRVRIVQRLPQRGHGVCGASPDGPQRLGGHAPDAQGIHQRVAQPSGQKAGPRTWKCLTARWPARTERSSKVFVCQTQDRLRPPVDSPSHAICLGRALHAITPSNPPTVFLRFHT
jgi:hypothetical protein